jgi:hypothetical protein
MPLHAHHHVDFLSCPSYSDRSYICWHLDADPLAIDSDYEHTDLKIVERTDMDVDSCFTYCDYDGNPTCKICAACRLELIKNKNCTWLAQIVGQPY